MDLVIVTKNKGIATVELNNKKVNSINEVLIEELYHCFENIENDNDIKTVILTGRGKFFSFGFDIPEFIDWPKDDFKRFITKFTRFYTYLFLFPKPVIAAINGHAIAGGCMVITACDYRIMVSGKAKISLNEITFGSTVIAGSVELLKYCAGQNNAEKILYGGKMYNAKEAQELGLIDEISKEEEFLKKVHKFHYMSLY